MFKVGQEIFDLKCEDIAFFEVRQVTTTADFG
jgi:hypothetical protein